MRQSAVLTDKKAQGQQLAGLLGHTAIHAHPDRALATSVDSNLLAFQQATNIGVSALPAHEEGRSFTNVPTRTPAPGAPANYATPACPAFPQRCPFGGACHACPVTVQAKLAINQPGDSYEQEADRMAERVMRMPESSIPATTASSTKSTPSAVPPSVHEVLRSPGRPLDAATRAFMEPRFEHDFSRVCVHTDARAAKSARSINALAYTAGSDIVFGTGQYVPETPKGKRLLAHELAHVIQQGKSQQLAMLSATNPVVMSSELVNPPIIARQADIGQAIVEVEEENKEPNQLEASDAAAIGEEVLKTVGYEDLIRLATEAGLLEQKETSLGEASIQRQLASVHDTVFRQAEAATFGALFTPYAVAAGIASQVDSPAPGPGDVVALGILAVGLAVATYTVLSRNVCDTQLIRCLENVWQPDWNRDTFGPRKDCGACHRECKHAGGVWPYYKCPD